jgi:hypothetical protein
MDRPPRIERLAAAVRLCGAASASRCSARMAYRTSSGGTSRSIISRWRSAALPRIFVRLARGQGKRLSRRRAALDRVLSAHAHTASRPGRDRAQLDPDTRRDAGRSTAPLRRKRQMTSHWAWDHDDDEHAALAELGRSPAATRGWRVRDKHGYSRPLLEPACLESRID